jgi:hypothetical protein
MASKRMFSKRLTESARFLQMPLSTQALYFHLGLNADDDGVVEAYNVMQVIGCAQDDLKVLVSKGYVKVLNEDLVTYITDWRENNTIRADRKTDSLYQDLLVSMFPDIDLLEKKQRSDVTPRIIDSTISSTAIEDKHNGQSMDGIDKDRLDKNSLGKDSLGKDRLDTDSSINQERLSPKFAKDVFELFITLCPSFAKPRKLTETRIDAISKLSQEYTLDDFREAFENMESSEYMRNGDFDFDKAISEKIFVNLLENKYRKYKKEPEPKKSNTTKFNKFSQRENYDYDALEKKMTGGV